MIISLFEIWGYISITDKIFTSSVVLKQTAFVWIALQFWYTGPSWSILNTCMPTPDSTRCSHSSYHWGYQVIYSSLWNVIPLLIYWACMSWSLLFGMLTHVMFLLFISSLKCSIGVKSGLKAAQLRTGALFSPRFLCRPTAFCSTCWSRGTSERSP